MLCFQVLLLQVYLFVWYKLNWCFVVLRFMSYDFEFTDCLLKLFRFGCFLSVLLCFWVSVR